MRNEHAQGSLGSATPDQGQVYTWTFPGAPIRINIQLSLILKLQAEASQDQKAGYARMVGGLLFGQFLPPGTVEISDCVFLASAPSSPNRYVLDVSELERVRRERGNSSNGRRPSSIVGFFRAQQEHGLALRDDEIALIQRHFRDPGQVVLLIHVAPDQCTAGFLFWDGDDVVPFSLLDFPLDAGALKIEGATVFHEPIEQGPAREEEIEPAETPAAVPSARPWTSRSLAGIGATILGAILLVGGVIAFTRWNHAPPPKPSASAAPRAEFMQLQVEVQGSGLNLRWNPGVAQIAQANAGRLVVMEGDRPQRVVDLDAEQLKSGHVYYQASADQVRFRLEVSNVFGLLTKESILVLLSGTGAASPSVPGKAKEIQAAPKVIKAVRIDDPPPDPLAGRNDVRPLTTPAAAQGAEARAVAPKSEPPPPIATNRGQDSVDSHEPVAEQRVSNRSEQAKTPVPSETAKALQPLPSNPAPPPVSPAAAIDSSRAPVSRPAGTPLPPASDASPLARPPAATSSPAPNAISSPSSSSPVPNIPRTDPRTSPVAPSPATPAPSVSSPGALSLAAPSPAEPSRSPNYVAPVSTKQASPLITPDVRAEVNSGEGKLVVAVRVVIDASGKVKSAQLVSSTPPSDVSRLVYVKAAALGAARVWQFRPATLNGINIVSEYIIEFKFR